MISRKKQEPDFTKRVIIAMGIWIVVVFIVEHIIFILHGSCPTEIYIATIPPILTEAICLTKLTLDKRKYENEEGQG